MLPNLPHPTLSFLTLPHHFVYLAFPYHSDALQYHMRHCDVTVHSPVLSLTTHDARHVIGVMSTKPESHASDDDGKMMSWPPTSWRSPSAICI